MAVLDKAKTVSSFEKCMEIHELPNLEVYVDKDGYVCFSDKSSMMPCYNIADLHQSIFQYIERCKFENSPKLEIQEIRIMEIIIEEFKTK